MFTIAPGDLKKLRKGTGKTQTEAARDVWVSMRTWQSWEQPTDSIHHRKMPTAHLELFCIKNKIRFPPE